MQSANEDFRSPDCGYDTERHTSRTEDSEPRTRDGDFEIENNGLGEETGFGTTDVY